MNQRYFFASANTTDGFQNYFHTIFDPNRLQQIYIIKGGPGTGKSSLMKQIASKAEALRLHVEQYLCSSDPNSLDGIIIQEKGIAVIDGTAPHTAEPNYPGVVENIINTGLCWDKAKLIQNKRTILLNIQEKSRYYRRAYQFLKAMGDIESEILKIGEQALDADKAKKSIHRLSEKLWKTKGAGKVQIRLTESYNAKGCTKLSSFAQIGKKIYIIEDALHSSHFYLEEILQSANETMQDVYISKSPLFPHRISGLYFPKTETSFVIGEKNSAAESPEKEYHYINMNRFLDKEIIRENRQKIRFAAKCSEMLQNGATDAFSQALDCHKVLEKIYIDAMDFLSLQEMTDALMNEIFQTEI